MQHETTPAVTKRRYRLTRLGVHFVFVAAFTMVGGALRGFNLLLVLAGLLTGALLVQWRYARWMLESTQLSRTAAPEAFAEVPFRIRYRIENLSRHLPLWMLRIDDEVQLPSSGETITAGCGVGVVGPKQTATASYDIVVSSRGRYQLGIMSVSTLFPISLLNARKISQQPQSFWVYPSLLKLRKGWQHMLLTRQGGAAAAARRSGPNEGDFFGLREWQTGDNPKWIHHRTTARVGEPIVRQFEQQKRFDACLLVDCFDAGRAGTGVGSSAAVERAISFAATIVTSMDISPTSRLVLAVAAEQGTVVSGSHVHGAKRKMLELLAEAKPSSLPDLVESVEGVLQVGHAKDLIVVSPRDLTATLSEYRQTPLESRLQRWSRRGGLRWINVRSPQFQSLLVTRPVGESDESVMGERQRA